MLIKIAFAGSDSRTLVSALIVSTAKSENSEKKFQGVVFRGSPAMEFQNGKFFSDGSRVCFITANASMKPGQKRSESVNLLREKLLRAFDEGKVRVVPRENSSGNRLDLRRDIGSHYEIADEMFGT